MIPDLWLYTLTFVTGFNLAATGALTGATAYVLFRYVYRPWQVMRADVKALADQIDTIKEEMGLRRAMTMSDEEQAMIERRAKARQLWSGPGAPTAPTIQKAAR